MLTTVLGSFAVSILMVWIVRMLPRRLTYLTALLPGALFIYFLSHALNGGGEVLHESVLWYKSLGVNLTFRLDGLSLTLCLLITGIGTLIYLYAYGYMGNHEHIDRFYLLISVFMSAMIGLVLADNLLLLFVFWEITTLTSYLLVGFNHKSDEARKSALQALIVTGVGGLIMLAGILILGTQAGTYEISEILALDLSAKQDVLSLTALLIIAGCFTKSAQFPFHFWLPNAMAAPTPVSAYLHSATMVKAGIYLMYRINPLYFDVPVWQNSLIASGAITMVFAAVSGIFYRDLKKILAYSTLSVLGMLTLMAGLGTDLSIKAGLTVLTAHALYKAALFMTAGSIDHETGTRDTQLLGGLKKLMPITFITALLAGASQAGILPFFGFIGKEYLLKSTLYSQFPITLTCFSVVAGALVFMLALTVCLHPFTGKPGKTPVEKIHEAPVSMLAGPIALSAAGLTFGIIPFTIDNSLLAAAATQAGVVKDTPLQLWHGVNTPLLLSILSVSIGIAGYIYRRKIWILAEKISSGTEFRFEKLFNNTLSLFINFCKWQTRIIQNGSLKTYLVISISGFMLILGLTFFSLENIPYKFSFKGAHLPIILFLLALTAAALIASFSSSLLTSLIAISLIGFGLAVIYSLFGAPDLAITQIMVETLTAVMFMAVIYKLPKLKKYSSRKVTIFDFSFAICCGLMITLLILKAQGLQLSTPVSNRMAELSYSEAKGRNMVNVILVDFRALDTLGEIAVLATAAIGAYVLLKGRKAKESDS